MLWGGREDFRSTKVVLAVYLWNNKRKLTQRHQYDAKKIIKYPDITIKMLSGNNNNKKNTRFQLYARAYGRYARAPAIAESIRCDKEAME